MAHERTCGDWIRPFFFERDALQRRATQGAASYATAQPFPHAVFDDLFPDDVIDGLLSEFPDGQAPGWTYYDDRHQRKLQGDRRELHGPFTRHILSELMSADFLAFLETLTGVRGLLTDPSLHGGGLQQISPGGYLNIHTDQTFEPRLRLERRVNVILYLNREWSPTYGGDLELWDDERSSCIVSIAPLAGRVVVFNTRLPSWHGHPRPLECPVGIARRSLALYYFTSAATMTSTRARSSDRWPGRGHRAHVTKNYVCDMLPPSWVSRLSRWRQSLTRARAPQPPQYCLHSRNTPFYR